MLNNDIDRNYIETIITKYIGDNITYSIVGDIHLGRNIVIYINSLNVYLKIYGEEKRWRQEVSALAQLYDDNSVPDLLLYGIDEGWGWVLITSMKGKCLMEAYCQMNYIEKCSVQSKIGIYLRKFHKKSQLIPYWKPSYIELRPFKQLTFSSFIALRISYFKKVLSSHEESLVFKDALSYLDKTYSLIMSYNENLFLCHNDYGARNIILDGQNIRLFDFESSFFAPREYDIANVKIENYFNGLFDSFIAGYLKCGDFIDYKLLDYFVVFRCLDICSWSFYKERTYYMHAKNILTDVMSIEFS